jgi:hypothetical protein
MKKENESCPFCGAIPKYRKSYKSYLIIHKKDCFFNKGLKISETLLKVSNYNYDIFRITAWNTRTKNNPEITEEEQENILNNILKQNLQISKQIKLTKFRSIEIECYDCGKIIGLINMYRCFQCGLYICGNCAPAHFNIDKSKLPKYIKDKNNG